MKSIIFIIMLTIQFNIYAQLSNPSVCKINQVLNETNCLSPDIFDINVTSAPGSVLGTDVMVSEVKILIQHTYVSDLEIRLISPNGVTIPLAISVGGDGDHFGNPGLNHCNLHTTFKMSGTNGSIISGTAPFIGNYIPEGNFVGFNDGSSPIGNWKLSICDGEDFDIGRLHYVEIKFKEIEACLDSRFDGVGFASGHMFDIENTGSDTLVIESFKALFTSGSAIINFDVYYTTVATTHMGNETNAGAWTLLGSTQFTADGGFETICVGSLELEPSERKGLYLLSSSLPMYDTNWSATYTDGKLLIDADPGTKLTGRGPFDGPQSGRIWNGSICYSVKSSPPPCDGTEITIDQMSSITDLHAASSINTSGNVTIPGGSDICWKAGSSITLGPNFSLDGVFEASIENCSN